MAAHADLDSLRGLYQDLSSLSRSALPDVDRLVFALETTIGDFRQLLDKSAKSDESRKKVLSGTIKIDDVEFQINQEFQQEALQIADALNVDELSAAEMFLEAQQISGNSSAVLTAIIRFHERRAFLLECLRLIFTQSCDVEKEEVGLLMQDCVGKILEIETAGLKSGSTYARKCMDSMADIEHWLVLLGEQLQKAAVVGQAQDPDVVEVIEYQRQSLRRQHESLGSILSYLFKSTFTKPEDLRELLRRLQKTNRFDACLVHYLPAVIAGFAQFAPPEGSGGHSEASSLNKTIVDTKEPQWQYPRLHAAIKLLWIAEYSAWTADLMYSSSPMAGKNQDQVTTDMNKTFKEALDDGALEFILSVCAQAEQPEQPHSSKSELVALLLKDDDAAPVESYTLSDHFHATLMEYIELFTQSLIANIPDAIRHLKAEEDSQRLDQITALREGLSSTTGRSLTEVRMHFESLLVIMSFAFEHRMVAAQEVWAEPDGNIYGFLSFTSRRQTVPTASAFCELLCALSEGEENSTATHNFLLEEDSASAKFRRSSHMGWNQMISELQIYASKATEKPAPAAHSILHIRKFEPADIDEPESPVMLTSYLRLISHLCEQSEKVRHWLLHHPSFNLISTLLELCSASIPSHLRSFIFITLKSLMVGKTDDYGIVMWNAIDHWVSVTGVQGLHPQRVASVAQPSMGEDHVFQRILEATDQTNAFVELLSALVSIPFDLADAQLCLSFPENLGASYRMPGIEPYVDFVMGQVLVGRATSLTDGDALILRLNCLNFAALCLESFNESLISLANQSEAPQDLSAPPFSTYIRLHPFARVMEWLFNEDVLKVIFATSHQDVSEVEKASPSSVLVRCLCRTLDVMNLVLNLQVTYLDIVRPLIKAQPDYATTPVTNSSLSSFEESVMDNLSLISDLCLYCGTLHPELTLISLGFLGNLASSRKLNKISSGIPGWQYSNPLVEALSSQVEVDRVAQLLAQQMRIDIRELENGPAVSGYQIKTGLAHLINRCLEINPDKPNIAHVLLGFSCIGSALDVDDGVLDPKMSLLSAIVELVKGFPVSFDGAVMISWMYRLKRLSFQILKRLYSSKLSSNLILPELRAAQLYTTLFLTQPPVTVTTLWDGFTPLDATFWETDSAVALSELLAFRGLVFDYAATEIRYTSKILSSTYVRGLLNTALGISTGPNNENLTHASMFDLFDFAELDLNISVPPPAVAVFADVNFDLCTKIDEDTELVLYDLEAVQEVLELTRTTILDGHETTVQDEEQIMIEKESLYLYFKAVNQARVVRHHRYFAVKSWAQLATTIVLACDMDAARRAMFILHVLQNILPKLEASISSDAPESIELARLAETLIEKLGSTKHQAGGARGGDIIDERLHSLFQTCVAGVPSVLEQTELRECLYTICSRYLTRIIANASSSQCVKAHQVIQVAGSAFVETVCEDAYAGQESCRISALLLLNLLANLDRMRSSSLIVDCITRSNHLAMFIDVVRTIPDEFRQAQAMEAVQLLVYYEAHLTLLVGLARTRIGAERLLEAGLFQAVEDSQLFGVDPDIGIEMDSPSALRDHHTLLLAILRVIVATVFSRGAHNQQVRQLTRTFLLANRPCIINIFKRFSKVGPTKDDPKNAEVLEELVKSYVALITAVDLVEFEEVQIGQPAATLRFS